jgi:glucokinase
VSDSILGLELQDHGVVAVAIDETGRVLGRGAAAASSGDLRGASLTAAGQAAAGLPAPVASLGVAAHNPDSAECHIILQVLAERLQAGRPAHKESASTSGTAAAVGEAWVGAGRDARDVVFFAVAEHTEAGIVRDGAPVLGATRGAAAIGWLALNPVEREDYRKMGCLEAEVAASGIVRRLIWRIKAGDRSRVQGRVDGDLSSISVEHVLQAAREGDGVSISVLRDTAKYLGMAAANLVVIADPAVLVLGGIMASAADLLFEPVRVEIGRRVPASRMQALTIAPATLGVEAAAIGAARLATAALQ